MQYVPNDTDERILRYTMYMKSDLGLLNLLDRGQSNYDLLNGHIHDHLCEIEAFLETYDLTAIDGISKLVEYFEEVTVKYTDHYIRTIGFNFPIYSDIFETLRKYRI